MRVRAAEATELDQLAKVWFDGWHEAHARIVPAELTRVRTLPSFRDRLQAALPDTRTVGDVCSPLGFCVVKGDEVYQLFVAKEARGTGVAAALLADAEARLSANGVATAWLACAIGNDRAARFYEKVRLAPRGYGRQPRGNVGRRVCAGCVAVREAAGSGLGRPVRERRIMPCALHSTQRDMMMTTRFG